MPPYRGQIATTWTSPRLGMIRTYLEERLAQARREADEAAPGSLRHAVAHAVGEELTELAILVRDER